MTMMMIIIIIIMVADDLAQAFASVDEEEMPESDINDPQPHEAVPQFPQRYSAIPDSSAHGVVFPPDAMSGVVYPPGSGSDGVYPEGSAPIHSALMVHGDFNQAGATTFQMEDPSQVFQADQGAWHAGLENEPVLPPPPSGGVPQGDMMPEFHPNLESRIPGDPHEGNLAAWHLWTVD